MQLDRQTTQRIIDEGKARGLKGEDVLNGLIERGYQPEGIDITQAKSLIELKKEKSGGLVTEAAGDIKDIGRDVDAAAQNRGAKFNEIEAAEASGQQGPLRSLFQKFGQGLGLASDVVGAVTKGAVKAVMPEQTERDLGKSFEKTVALIGDQQLVQDGIGLFKELQQKDPALARDLETAINFAMLATEGTGVAVTGAVAKKGAKVAAQGAEALGDGVSATGRGAGFVGSELSGAFTGTSGETIRQAFDAARKGGKDLQEFTDALRKKTTPEQLVNRLRESSDMVSGEKTKRFGAMLDSIGTETVETNTILPDFVQDLDKVGIRVGADGDLDFSASKFRTVPQAQKKLQAAYDEISNLGDTQTVRGIDTSRQALGALELAGDDASARTANMVITAAKARVREAGAKVPGYQQALTQFGDDAEFLEQISRSLSSGDQATIDTAYRRLATALKTNNEQRMNLLKELDEATDGYILSGVAGQQLSEELPRGLFRQIVAGGAVFNAFSGGLGTLLTPAILFASPRATGEVLRALGIGAGKIDALLAALNKVRTQMNMPSTPAK